MTEERFTYKRGGVYFDGERLDLGSAILSYGALVWMAWAVGPAWVGLAIFSLAMFVNLFVVAMFFFVRWLEKRRAYGDRKTVEGG